MRGSVEVPREHVSIRHGSKKLALVFGRLEKALKGGDQRVLVNGNTCSRVEPEEQGSAEICRFRRKARKMTPRRTSMVQVVWESYTNTLFARSE